MLSEWREGNDDAFEPLWESVYGEMRRLAHSKLRGERVGHTLNTTALVHEAYFKLAGQNRDGIHNRSHFLALAALAIEKATRAFSARHPEIDPPIAVCLGVASGTASVGNMGSRQRFNYSVIGDTVNVAARLESNCRHLSAELVFSQRAFDATPELAWIYAGRLSLKGISERQPTFLLVGDAEMKLSDAFKRFEEAYGSLAAALENGHSAEPFLSECRSLAPDLSAQLMPYLDRIADRRTDFEPDQSPIQIATIAT